MKQVLQASVALNFTYHVAVIANCQVPSANPPVVPAATVTSGSGRQLTPEMIEQQRRSREDRQDMMNLLHISSLREGANGSNKDAPNYANYDESKANPYSTLPDPLVMKNGKKVTTAAMWWNKRRPEIVEDFDREIYGRVPKVTPKVEWEITKTVNETNGGVPVTTKLLLGHVDNSSYPAVKVDIQMALTTPANASGPVPVIMEFGFAPGFGAARPGFGALRAGVPGGAPPGPTWQQQVLAKGWGYAEIVPGSIQADNGAGLTAGIIGLVNKGQPRKPDDWGSLRAWAWGASRALDYFETDNTVDAKRVGIEGHSRYGKATIVTMAYDSRFAIAFVSSSGEGGAKLHRRNWGELVENVAAPNEYHWMAGNFLKYAGPLNWNDMPVDSHELVAMCAPRPVFLSAGATQGDGWVDAKGTFLAGVGAGPVYKLLGKKDLGTGEFPAIQTGLMEGDLTFRQHSGGHTPAPNWPTFISFADRYFSKPVTARE
ncbi:MAG: acetylxylan esterase [Acidobacteriota bacterium]|nr:acetylxylan esterase [Acidobacteriota bacterium]